MFENLEVGNFGEISLEECTCTVYKKSERLEVPVVSCVTHGWCSAFEARIGHILGMLDSIC